MDTGFFAVIRAPLMALSLAILLALASPAIAQTCAGDINDDGKVDGGDLGVLLTNWGTCPAAIQSVSPTQGSVLGGTIITILGSGLATTSGAAIGGVPCTAVQVLSPSQVRATTPAGSVGAALITVTTASGTLQASVTFSYTQQSVTSIVPNTGPYNGGTSITIVGSGLSGTTGVTVGGVPATSFQVVSAGSIVATTPAGSVGPVDVVLSGSFGTLEVPDGFSYQNQFLPAWATLIEANPNPTVIWNPSLRAAIAASGLPWRVKDTATQIEMVLIPPGTFQMGCSASSQYGCSSDESPVHQVTLTNAFYLGRYEITQAQWSAKMGSNPSSFQSSSGQVPSSQVPSRPVDSVTWNMVAGSGGFLAQTGMRLPTEAEWEYAYRAGATTAFHGFTGYLNGTNNDSLVGNIAWSGSNSVSQTRPVGGKLGNGLGLYDMSGNVWEWVSDWYGATYYGSGPVQNPTGPLTGTSRVLRGGSWFNPTNSLRSSYRYYYLPGSTFNDFGFRVARNP